MESETKAKIEWRLWLMRGWKDFNRAGELDGAERMFAEEMLCGSREEHIRTWISDLFIR